MVNWFANRVNAETGPVTAIPAEERSIEDALAELRIRRAPAVEVLPARQRRRVLEDAIGAKILRSHIANRLQTSFPLTLNLQRNSDVEVEILLAAMAAALAAGGATPRPIPRDLPATIGAPKGALPTLQHALQLPRPLPTLIEEILAHRLEAEAYALAVAALPRPNASEQAFLAYLAIRLALPAETVRGIMRRYRR